MKVRKIRDLTLTAASQPGRPPYLSSASGLVRMARQLYVVADDELHLGVFPFEGTDPGSLLRLFPGELPLPTSARKKVKADFEALVLLPPFGRYGAGALLALGSGSRNRREVAALLAATEHGVDERTPARRLDTSKVIAALAKEVDDANVEGAIVVGERLVLMHRGNAKHPSSALVSLDLPPLLASIDDDDKFGKVRVIAARHYELGKIDDAPLTFTDGTTLADGTILFSAVAEQADNSYLDGPFRGAAIGEIAPDGQLRRIEYLEQAYKIEGVYAEPVGRHHRLWLVSDADDVNVPAALLVGAWE